MSIPTPITLTFSRLRNAEWLSFHTEFLALVANDPSPGPAGVGVSTPLWNAYAIAHANARESFAYERASALTQLITEADQSRDQAYRDLYNAVLAHQHSSDADVRLAAERILTFLDNEKNIAQDTLSGESSSIANIDTAFTGPLAGCVTLLQISPWHERLLIAQQAFLRLWRQRTDETATLTALRMSKERPKLDLLYHHVLGAIQAQTYATPVATAQPAIDCITRLNTVVIKYKEIVSRRSAASAPELASGEAPAALPSGTSPEV